MNLRDELLAEHSKIQAQKIAGWIGNDEQRFAQLIHLFLHDEYRVVQRAARIVSIVPEQYPDLITPHLETIVNRMQEPDLPVAVKRNVVRLLQHISIPEQLHGPVMNTCFEMLADVKETIAVRAFSMTVLGNLARVYPELKPELTAIIEDQLERESTPGFRSRAKKVLAELKQITAK